MSVQKVIQKCLTAILFAEKEGRKEDQKSQCDNFLHKTFFSLTLSQLIFEEELY